MPLRDCFVTEAYRPDAHDVPLGCTCGLVRPVSELVTGVIGACAGGLVTAFGTWRVSVSLDRRQRMRERQGAITIVRAELIENAGRVPLGGLVVEHAEGLYAMPTRPPALASS